jgi:prepilin-type N-terminal cleavage/methylation domain-containing protein
MLKNNKRNAGFTIIEVMIVLAIAGLIMLIVFLAVPALQRNSRNTQYKNDAASLLSATTEWSNNHSGQTPVASTSTTAGSNAADIAALAKTQSITTLTIKKGAAGSQTQAVTAFDTAFIITGVKCTSNTGNTATLQGGVSARALSMVYAVEDSSGNQVAQCTES